MEISDAWEDVLRHQIHVADSVGFNFIERRFHEPGVDRLSPLKFAMHGNVKLTIFMGFLADPEGVEIQRSGAYITDNENNLRNLLKTPRFLVDLVRPAR